jgi:hypothetical protein
LQLSLCLDGPDLVLRDLDPGAVLPTEAERVARQAVEARWAELEAELRRLRGNDA